MQIVDAQIHTWGTGLPSNLSHRPIGGRAFLGMQPGPRLL
jgi:hypothetical protein